MKKQEQKAVEKKLVAGSLKFSGEIHLVHTCENTFFNRQSQFKYEQ